MSEGRVRYGGVKALCLSETSNQDQRRKRSDLWYITTIIHGIPSLALIV